MGVPDSLLPSVACMHFAVTAMESFGHGGFCDNLLSAVRWDGHEIFRENMLKKKNIIRIALATAFILLIPLAAMQFSDEVDWNRFDFVVAGALLFGSGLAFELVARKSGDTAYRAAVGVAVATALLLAWINLAVGIIGSEDNPANLMYFAVLFVGILGAGMARLRPRGMARAMFATAIALALVPVIALAVGKSQAHALQEPPGVWGVLALNAFFVMLFVVSALLFRRSAQDRSAGSAA
jgi:hypothetical protein